MMKVLALRRAATCSGCGAHLDVGTKAAWDAADRTVTCLSCAAGGPSPATTSTTSSTNDVVDLPPAKAPLPTPPLPRLECPLGHRSPKPNPAAGASAQREYDKRSQRREVAIRSRHPRLGGLVLALTNEPASTRVWAQGAHGERAVAAKIDELEGEHVLALHDRRMLRPDGRPSRANIDHLVVAATGIGVVDAKTHQGALEVRRSGGLFSPRIERLFIGGRDKTSLFEGLAKQVDAVRAVLLEVAADVPVRGAFCFVGTELPWFGDSIGGIPLVGRRSLAKLLKTPGDLAADDREALASYLETRFIPA